MFVRAFLTRMTWLLTISTIVACTGSTEPPAPTPTIEPTSTLEPMPAQVQTTSDGLALPQSRPVHRDAAQHLPPAWLIAGDEVVLSTYGSYILSYKDESGPPGENGEVNVIVEHGDMIPPESNPDLATVVLSADEQAVVLIRSRSIKTFQADVAAWSDPHGPSRRKLKADQVATANLTAFALEPTGNTDDQLLSVSITFAEGEASYFWRLNPALLPGRLHGSPPCGLPAADAQADVGDPQDEPCHNLVGWSEAEIGGPVMPPSGDRSKRFQMLRGDNLLDLFVPQAHVPYTLVAEVEDGGSDDSFEIYVNGQGPVYTYHADLAIEAVVVHTIPIPAAVITGTTATVNFRNVASDDSGLAAVFNVAAVAGTLQDIKKPFVNNTPTPTASTLVWKRSPVWTGPESGPKDANGQFWGDPRFDDTEWTPVALPDRGRDSSADNRYYRSHFTWDGHSPVTIYFAADDGLSIYVNGNRLGSWGNGWRTEGCLNNPEYLCSFSTAVPPQTIPTSMLQTGDNVIAIDLWNAAVCCDYYLDVTVVSAAALTPHPTEAPVTPGNRTPTHSPIIRPVVQPVTSAQLPSIPNDLLFLDQGNLIRWNHVTGQLEPLAGSVTCFSVSADGRHVALASAGEDKIYKVILFDLATGMGNRLLETTQPLIDLALSPDKQWIVYLASDSSLGEGPCRPDVANVAMYPLASGGPYSGTIYALRLDGPEQPIKIGHCSGGDLPGPCSQVMWSPESQAVMWTDIKGVWLFDLDSSQPQLLVANVLNPGDPFDIRLYHPWRVSPSGRYVLTSVALYEGVLQAVIDTQTKQVTDVPDTGAHGDPGPMLIWLADERLLVLRPAAGYSNASPAPDDPLATLEIWRIAPNQPVRLVREKSLRLDVSRRTVPSGDPAQLADGRLAFALLNADPANAPESGLYLADLNNLTPRRVVGPTPVLSDHFYFQTGLVWSPDGQGLVFQDWGEATMLLYIPTDGTVWYDLRPVISDTACCFTWLP